MGATLPEKRAGTLAVGNVGQCIPAFSISEASWPLTSPQQL
jgi:hypothetical protein